MSDSEIIKALECCKNADCQNCPRWSEEWCSGMCNDFLLDVLDLINRQKAEIERLQKECNENFKKWEILDERTKQRYAELYEESKEYLKSEARKEFAKGLHKAIDDYRDKREMPMLPYTGYALDYVDRKIDSLLKEMESKDNAE